MAYTPCVFSYALSIKAIFVAIIMPYTEQAAGIMKVSH